ncbi:helix-turn-helix domain-containing protein [Enterobacteriaceae bacterium G50]|nr:helix-turn-helix domain-containing protein [Enterobacteriaceae bacterium G50]
MNTTYKNVTEKAVRSIGSVSAVARKFGFKSSQSVANWIIRNEVPSERVISLCEFGGWAVTPHELRPDLYPNSTDALPKKDIASVSRKSD